MTSERDAFYEVFWVLPNAPLPVPGEIRADEDESLPEPVLNKRTELQGLLASLDLTNTEQIQEAVGCCDLYVRSLRAARAVHEPKGHSMWTSAIAPDTGTVPFAFDEPMALVLQATLLLNLAASIAEKRTVECITEAAHCCCQAAGLVEYVITLEDDICSALTTDVPVHLPELVPRILRAFADMAVVMAQQLAIVKAALFEVEGSYNTSVLQKLHAACQYGYEAFETAVVRSCHSSHPSRQGCATLLGFACIFSRVHRMQTLLLAGQAEYIASDVGKAIGFVQTARKQLQERQSMREPGLPPMDEDGSLFQQHDILRQRIAGKRLALQELVAKWSEDNDSIYFESIPSEEAVLAIEHPRALIMKAISHNVTTRLGSATMFRKAVDKSNVADLVTGIDGTDTDRDDTGQHEEENDVVEEINCSGTTNDHVIELAFSRFARNKDEVHATQTASDDRAKRETVEIRKLAERASAPDVSTTAKRHAISLSNSNPVDLPPDQSVPPFASARSTRRMATRVQPQKAMTTRNLLGIIGKQDSLVTLQQSEDEMRKAVTDEALFRMRRTMLGGVEVYRFVREKWKKEVLRVQDDQVVLIRQRPIALLSKQLKFPWTAIHGFQHELQPTNHVLQLIAPPGKRMTSILVIARRGDMVEPTELTFKTPEENAVAVVCLQRFLHEKRGAGNGL